MCLHLFVFAHVCVFVCVCLTRCALSLGGKKNERKKKKLVQASDSYLRT